MDPRRRRRITWALLSLVFLASSIGTLALTGPTLQTGPIIINPGVILRPSQAWVDIDFSSQQSFSGQVIVRATGIALDNVSIEVQKAPPGLPRATMTITIWAPTAGNATTALEFVASSDPITTVWFNVTGLRPDMVYRSLVDGVLLTTTSTPGGASLSWSNWLSAHTFDVIAYIPLPPPNPPPGPPPPDTTPPAQVTDLRAVAWGPDFAVLGWTAPGDDGNVSQAGQYEFRYAPGSIPTGAVFFNGTRIPTGTPQPAGATETVNVTGLSPGTAYWFALRAADEVPNWSPISNFVAVQTLVTWEGVPTVNSVSLDTPSSEVEIVFSEPMNRTSVEQSLNITPDVSYEVQWQDDNRLTININAALSTNATYLLQIDPGAADQDGIPMARTFTFKFAGLAQLSESPGPLGLPFVIIVPLLTVLVGLAVTTTVTTIWVHQTRRKMRVLQGAVQALTRRTVVVNLAGRFRELRGRVIPSIRDSPRRILSFRGKK